jgi:hypothetical protein
MQARFSVRETDFLSIIVTVENLGKTTKHIQRKNMATLKLGAGVVPE